MCIRTEFDRECLRNDAVLVCCCCFIMLEKLSHLFQHAIRVKNGSLLLGILFKLPQNYLDIIRPDDFKIFYI